MEIISLAWMMYIIQVNKDYLSPEIYERFLRCPVDQIEPLFLEVLSILHDRNELLTGLYLTIREFIIRSCRYRRIITPYTYKMVWLLKIKLVKV